MSSASSPLLDFRDVSRSFTVRQGVLGRVRGEVRAVDGVSLSVRRGETLGLVGESGCGKSTLARMAVRLLPPTGGEILFDGESVLPGVSGRNDTWYSRRLQMIFQDPFSSLNPRLRIGTSIAEPLMAIGAPSAERQERVGEILRRVGLQPGHAGRYPHEFSGGQRQRVAIARAMSTNPKVLLCDEATSALDPNTTKSILELLKKINRELGITVIVITHEMAVIESICDRVAIIDHSHIAESGKVSEIFSGPKSEIGRQLILGETAGQKTSFARARQIRVIFNGQESSEPIISNMVLACKVPVNILLADTHDIGGKAMGQMLLQLPEDEVDAGRICNYLKTVGVTYEEVR